MKPTKEKPGKEEEEGGGKDQIQGPRREQDSNPGQQPPATASCPVASLFSIDTAAGGTFCISNGRMPEKKSSDDSILCASFITRQKAVKFIRNGWQLAG